MKIHYEKETDSLTISFLSERIDDSEEIRPGVIADFDNGGSLVSIEILNASRKVQSLNEVAYNSHILQAG